MDAQTREHISITMNAFASMAYAQQKADEAEGRSISPGLAHWQEKRKAFALSFPQGSEERAFCFLIIREQ